MGKIHTTIGVYRNGDYKTNGVAEEHLEEHIEHNIEFRYGRALLVDGVVVHRGDYKEDEVKGLEERFKDVKITVCTVPYH